MSLFLVRHASAQDRSQWAFDDLERPLDEHGKAQASTIAAFFAARTVRGVWSSQAIRCVETIRPVADTHSLSVEVRRQLTEGARPNDLLELLRNEAHVEGDLVMCSHGDLIPEVLNRLLREGMAVVGLRGCEKGSVWELETRGRDITRGVYIPPTSIARQ